MEYGDFRGFKVNENSEYNFFLLTTLSFGGRRFEQFKVDQSNLERV